MDNNTMTIEQFKQLKSFIEDNGKLLSSPMYKKAILLQLSRDLLLYSNEYNLDGGEAVDYQIAIVYFNEDIKLSKTVYVYLNSKGLSIKERLPISITE